MAVHNYTYRLGSLGDGTGIAQGYFNYTEAIAACDALDACKGFQFQSPSRKPEGRVLRWVPRTVVASRVGVPHPAWLEPKLSVTQSPFGGGRRPGRDHIEKAPKVVAVSTMASALETSSSA